MCYFINNISIIVINIKFTKKDIQPLDHQKKYN